MFCDWKDQYSINIESIDVQHHKLFDMVKALNEALESGQSKAVMGKFLNELIQYTQTHFVDEEKYMKDNGFPKRLFDEHVEEHKDLMKQVLAFKVEFETTQSVFTPKMITFLVDWLKNHIVRTDNKYAQFIHKR